MPSKRICAKCAKRKCPKCSKRKCRQSPGRKLPESPEKKCPNSPEIICQKCSETERSISPERKHPKSPERKRPKSPERKHPKSPEGKCRKCLKKERPKSPERKCPKCLKRKSPKSAERKCPKSPEKKCPKCSTRKSSKKTSSEVTSPKSSLPPLPYYGEEWVGGYVFTELKPKEPKITYLTEYYEDYDSWAKNRFVEGFENRHTLYADVQEDLQQPSVEHVNYSMKGPFNFGLKSKRKNDRPLRYIDIEFDNECQRISEFVFRNRFTHWIKVFVKVYEPQKVYVDHELYPDVSSMYVFRPSRWRLSIPKKVLMESPFYEQDGCRCIKVSASENVNPKADWNRLSKMRIILFHPCPGYMKRRLDDIYFFKDPLPANVENNPFVGLYKPTDITDTELHVLLVRQLTITALDWKPFSIWYEPRFCDAFEEYEVTRFPV